MLYTCICSDDRLISCNSFQRFIWTDISFLQQVSFVSDEIFPVEPTAADLKKKQRFCGYRVMIFWLYPKLKRRQRRLLSACLTSFIQARFPPTANEEDFADWLFSEFVERD